MSDSLTCTHATARRTGRSVALLDRSKPMLMDGGGAAACVCVMIVVIVRRKVIIIISSRGDNGEVTIAIRSTASVANELPVVCW